MTWLSFLFSSAVWAADVGPTGEASAEDPFKKLPSKINVIPSDKSTLPLKWHEEDPPPELRVLQDQPFPKRHRLEIGLVTGPVFTDPFLSVADYGGFVQYHFTEHLAAGVLAWAYSSSPSDALNQLRQYSNGAANTNDVHWFAGGEVAYSPLYGKVSLLGMAIAYLDTYISLGAGEISTQTGRYFAPTGSVGEQITLSPRVSLRLEYRLMYYSEMLLQQNPAASNYGNLFGPRGNLTDIVNLGFSVLFF